MKFTKAERRQVKLRLLMTGPSGCGKTHSGLLLASGLGGRIAVIDTERGSASLYSHLVEFDALDLTAPYTPERYIEAIRAAEAAGYDVIMIDTATHEWSGPGGCLEANEKLAGAKFQGNTWAAWNVTTPRHRAFIDALNSSSAHIICTGRSKTETAQSEGPGGKKRVVKLGMKTEQREGFEYEFTVALELSHESHMAVQYKDRTGLFAEPVLITADTGRQLLEWLNSGAPADEAADAARRIEALVQLGDDVALLAHLASLTPKGKDFNGAVWSRLSAELRTHVTAAVAEQRRRSAETATASS